MATGSSAATLPSSLVLWKEGGNVKSWKKRYFVPSSDNLHYFANQRKADEYIQRPMPNPPRALGSIVLTNCVIWNGHPETRERAASNTKNGKAENYFEILAFNRRYRLMAESEASKAEWKHTLLSNRVSRESWAVRFPDYGAVRNNVLEGHMVQLDGPKKRKTRNVVGTLFYLYLFRTITDAEPRYVLSLQSCEASIDESKMQLVIKDTKHPNPFIFFVEELDLLHKWYDFVSTTIQYARNVERLGKDPSLNLNPPKPEVQQESGPAPINTASVDPSPEPAPPTPEFRRHQRADSSSSSEGGEKLPDSDSEGEGEPSSPTNPTGATSDEPLPPPPPPKEESTASKLGGALGAASSLPGVNKKGMLGKGLGAAASALGGGDSSESQPEKKPSSDSSGGGLGSLGGGLKGLGGGGGSAGLPSVSGAKAELNSLKDPKKALNAGKKVLSLFGKKKGQDEEPEEEAAPPTPPEEPKRDEELERWQESFDKLIQGEKFIKHGRRGKPHERIVMVDSEAGELQWHEEGKSRSRDFIPVASIQEVVVGVHTPVLKKRGKRDTCFSVLGSRTLDLECPDMPTRDEWAEVFSVLPHIGQGQVVIEDGKLVRAEASTAATTSSTAADAAGSSE